MKKPELQTQPRPFYILHIQLSIDCGDCKCCLLKYIEKYSYCIKGCEQCHVVLCCDLTDLSAVLAVGTCILCIDHVGDVTLTKSCRDLIAALADLMECMCTDALGLQELCCTMCSLDVETKLVEAAD